ncbi:MAG: cell division protein FtsX [Gaiellales bacterium]
MKWRFFVSEAVSSIRGNVATTLAAIVTVLMVTFLLGVTLALGKWVYDYTVGVRNEVTVKAYISSPLTPKDKKNYATEVGDLENQIRALPYVKSLEYVSPAEALKRVSAKDRQLVQQLKVNPYPPSFWIKLTDPSRTTDVAQALGQIQQVRECGSPPCVTTGGPVTKRVLQTTKYILYFLAALMVLLAVAAVVLIQNTIRLSIFSRRREIEVMKLVGANNSFVRLPFMLEGMITGLLGAAAALALLTAVYAALNNFNRGLTDPARAIGVFTLAVLLCLFGLLLGGFGSMLTLRRFLRV